MASVFELARTLGEELQKTPKVEALLAAKKAYEEDPEISKAVEEYTKMHEEFQKKNTGRWDFSRRAENILRRNEDPWRNHQEQ